jgi:hypothetical protein
MSTREQSEYKGILEHHSNNHRKIHNDEEAKKSRLPAVVTDVTPADFITGLENADRRRLARAQARRQGLAGS